MAGFSWQVLGLCLLTLSGACLASRKSRGYVYGQGQPIRGECNLDNLNPLEPARRQQHEAGFSDFWDENHEQLRCAGVAVTRHVIEPRGLLLPSYNNAPMLVFVIQGQGLLGALFPGCPETYQSFLSPEAEQSQGRFRDQHQKLHNFYRGDVLALPVGVAHWVYNEGKEDLVVVVVHDTSNLDNQLDQNLRRFFLAGNLQQQERQGGSWQSWPREDRERQQGNNILQAFDTNVLAQAFNIHPETARKLQNENDWRGNIVRVHHDLRVLRPRRDEREQEEQGYFMTTNPNSSASAAANGLEETICSMRLRENLSKPERADVYTVRGGSISSLNSFNLPILKFLQLSAGRGFLRPGAMVTPHWTINANSITYVARGSASVQVVGHTRRPVYDGEVREGQLLIIPQNFAHFKLAGSQGIEWFTAKTNDLANSSPLAGRTSVLRAMPEDVLINAYQLTREEARSIKYSRQEVTILSPLSESQ